MSFLVACTQFRYGKPHARLGCKDSDRKLIIARANTREMGKVAIGQGMRTLRMVALDRVRDGTSTLEQVLVLTSSH